MRKFFLVMMLPIFAACSGSSDDDGSGNTSDVAVTGTVEKVGMSYAIVNGYVNLNLITTDGKTEIGIEYSTYSDGSGRKQKTSSVTGNKISVKLSDLIWPNTTYYYRTYVKTNDLTHYGQTRQFTTEKGFGITSTGDVSDITTTTAVVSGTAKLYELSQDEKVQVGVAYSIKKEKLEDGPVNLNYSVFNDDYGYAFEGYNSSFSLNLKNLKPGTHYYYSAFNSIGTMFYFSEIKEFTTKSSQ